MLVSLRLDFDNRDRLFQNVVRDSSDAMQAFQKLAEVTPSDAIVFSWWDYGRSIKEFGRRSPVVAYPSRDVLQSVGFSENPISALEMQLFGTFESSDRIHDAASAFLVPEDESLVIMRKYGATHVMVFHSEEEHGSFSDFEKFPWIARIAGYNASDYLQIKPTSARPRYELTPKAEQVTILRLLLDERFHPQHFTKLYDDEVAKIFRIEYSPSQLTTSMASSFMALTAPLAPLTTRSTTQIPWVSSECVHEVSLRVLRVLRVSMPARKNLGSLPFIHCPSTLNLSIPILNA